MDATNQQRIQELEQAFQLFNETSDRLTDSYQSLQNQIESLQHQLEESDREKHQVADRLSRLLTLLPAAVVVLNDKNIITEMNQSAQALLGEQSLNMDWQLVCQSVFPFQGQKGEWKTRDDRTFQLAETEQDEANNRIFLLQDVTEARRWQEHENRHQRLHSMGEMAASLAHQIRTPLASALLYVSQLNSDDIDENNRQRFVAKSLTSLRHLEGLVKDMLQYAKGGKSCEQVLSIEQLFSKLANVTAREQQPGLGKLVFDRSQAEVQLTGDQDALVTALQNLINNAFEVIGDSALVQVSAKRVEGNYVDLIVSDNGPGIEAERIEQIFEPFYTSRAQGTGLGLAVVRAIADAHHGEVWVKSIVGFGSKFGMRLPTLPKHE